MRRRHDRLGRCFRLGSFGSLSNGLDRLFFGCGGSRRFGFGLGLGFMLLYVVLYLYATPHREITLIRGDNLPAAIVLAGAVLGFALPLASALRVAEGALDVAAWAFVALLAQLTAYALDVHKRRDAELSGLIEVRSTFCLPREEISWAALMEPGLPMPTSFAL